MNLSKWIKVKGHVFTCPFCQFPLTINDHPYFLMRGKLGYDCLRCVIPGVKTAADTPYPQYNISVMSDVPVSDDVIYDQLVMEETFSIHVEGSRWYNVHNSLLREQTSIVLMEPARKEHFYDGDKVCGMAHVSQIMLLPFTDSWEPSDKVATLNKIKTFLLFS
jgi:hypothetical protein